MAHDIFALVFNGVVANVVVGNYTDCDEVAKASYGNNAFAVDVTYIPVQSGDTYHDGIFERTVDGVTHTIDPILSESQKIELLLNKATELRDELDAVSMSVLDLVIEVDNKADKGASA